METNDFKGIQLIESEDINFIKKNIADLKTLIEKTRLEKVLNERYTKNEARAILKVSVKTFDSYLAKGIIPFSQYKSKVYIKAIDLEAFFEKFYVKK